MPDANQCPKCGLAVRAGLQVFYCYGPTERIHCVHGVKHEHLFTPCACGYVLDIKPCVDAEKPDAK